MQPQGQLQAGTACLAKGQDSSPELQRCPKGPVKAQSCPAPAPPSTPTQRLQPCSTDGGPRSKHRALEAQAWSPAQEGQVEPASEASLPSPNSPKIPEAWLSYPGDRPALLAGSKDGGSKRAGPWPSPTGVTMLRARASLLLSRGPVLPALWTPQGVQPPPHPQTSSREAAGTFRLSLPHMGLLPPVLGTLGGHRASPQAPPAFSPTPCGSQGRTVPRRVGPGSPAPSASSVLSVGPAGCSQQGAPFPGSPFPALAHRAWTG